MTACHALVLWSGILRRIGTKGRQAFAGLLRSIHRIGRNRLLTRSQNEGLQGIKVAGLLQRSFSSEGFETPATCPDRMLDEESVVIALG
jgi:hypothetical protein